MNLSGLQMPEENYPQISVSSEMTIFTWESILKLREKLQGLQYRLQKASKERNYMQLENDMVHGECHQEIQTVVTPNQNTVSAANFEA